MAEDYNIKCKNCNIDVTVTVGIRRLAMGAAVCYCTKCTTINNVFRCCRIETQSIGPPKEFGESSSPEKVKVTTMCPKCEEKSLEWEFVREYET